MIVRVPWLERETLTRGKSYDQLGKAMNVNMSKLTKQVKELTDALDKGVAGNVSNLELNWTRTYKDLDREFTSLDQRAKLSLEDATQQREGLSDAREVPAPATQPSPKKTRLPTKDILQEFVANISPMFLSGMLKLK